MAILVHKKQSSTGLKIPEIQLRGVDCGQTKPCSAMQPTGLDLKMILAPSKTALDKISNYDEASH